VFPPIHLSASISKSCHHKNDAYPISLMDGDNCRNIPISLISRSTPRALNISYFFSIRDRNHMHEQS